MKKHLLLLLSVSLLVLTSCKGDKMEEDAIKFVELKCKLDSIDSRNKAGDLNFIETEDAKEPIFEEMDVLRRRYRHEKQQLDSLIDLKVKETVCSWQQNTP